MIKVISQPVVRNATEPDFLCEVRFDGGNNAAKCFYSETKSPFFLTEVVFGQQIHKCGESIVPISLRKSIP